MNEQLLTTWIRTDDLSRYPASHVRAEADAKLIAEYAEAMLEGAQFPPIVIFEEEGGARHLADGLHRTDAAALAALKDPQRKSQVLAEVRRGTLEDALSYAMQANARHGKRLTEADYKRQIELAFDFGLVALHRADAVVPALVQLIGCSIQTAQKHSENKRQEIRQQRDRSILAMHRLGWTQERIAKAADVDQRTVSRVIERFRQNPPDSKMPKQERRAEPPVVRDTAIGKEQETTEADPAIEAPKVESRYRINVSPYLPLLDALRPLDEPADDSGTIVELPDIESEDEAEATKSATNALQTIGYVLNTMMGELDHPKGMHHRYPAKAAEFALDALERAIEFLNDLEIYVKDGVRK